MILSTNRHAAMQAHFDAAFGFIGYEIEVTAPAAAAPHQSHRAKYPGSTTAARDLGVSRTHLHAVLSGKRASRTLTARWHAWLKANPHFAALHHNRADQLPQ